MVHYRQTNSIAHSALVRRHRRTYMQLFDCIRLDITFRRNEALGYPDSFCIEFKVIILILSCPPGVAEEDDNTEGQRDPCQQANQRPSAHSIVFPWLHEWKSTTTVCRRWHTPNDLHCSRRQIVGHSWSDACFLGRFFMARCSSHHLFCHFTYNNNA